MRVFFPDFRGMSLLEALREARTDLAARERAWALLTRAVTSLAGIARSGGHGMLPLEAVSRSGPESVLCAEDGTLFILPPTLYRRCCAAAGEATEIENRVAWVHPDPDSVSPERAFAFLAGTLAYRILSGKNAFEPGESADKKSERPAGETLARDMRKGRFEPARFAAPSLCWDACRILDDALSPHAEEGAATEIAAFLGKGLSLADLSDPSRSEAAGTAEFAKKREAHGKKLRGLRKREAFFTAHRGALTGGGIAILIVAAIVGTTLNDMSRRPSTKGMDASQVVDRFYEGIATLDQEWPTACLAKGVKTDYGNFLTSLYVTAKVRESYERNGGILSPALLFALGGTEGRPVYGMTGLEIARDSADPNAFEASFYLWIPSSESSGTEDQKPGEQLSVYRYTDRLTLGLVKDRWRIVSFEPLVRHVEMGDGDEILREITEGSALSQAWAPRASDIEAAAQANVRGPILGE